MIQRCAAVLTGLAVAVGAAAGTAVANAVPASPSDVPAFWESATADLDSVLLRPRHIAAIINGPRMTLAGRSDKLFDHSGSVDARDCLSAFGPAEQQSYAGSGWRGVNSQLVTEGKKDDGDHMVVQSVVGFSSAAAATDYLRGAAASWTRCANREFVVASSGGAPARWRFGSPSPAAPDTVMTIGNASASGAVGCERAMGARDEIVIDVMVCTANPSGHGAAVVRGIAENMSQPA